MKHELRLEYVKPETLKPFDKNPRRISDEGLKKLEKSIAEFGFIAPIIAQAGTGLIIAGHQRLRAAKAAGEKAVPVIFVEFDDATAIAYNLADNRIAEEATWEETLLAGLLEDLEKAKIDLLITGFDSSEIDALLAHDEVLLSDDEVPAAQAGPARTKRGDMYALGNHRLLCGDSTKAADYERLTKGEPLDCVFADAPYGVNATGGRTDTVKKHGIRQIANDDLTGDRLVQFLAAFLRTLKLKPGAAIYLCYGWQTQAEFTAAIREAGLNIKDCIVWNKKVFGLNGFKWYRPQHEFIYFAYGTTEPLWHGDRGEGNIWDIAREIDREEQGNHPTPKPLELVGRALRNSTKAGDTVYDAFGGSGTTLITAEKLGRRCLMMELDEKYCDVIIERWERLTGNKTVLIKD